MSMPQRPVSSSNIYDSIRPRETEEDRISEVNYVQFEDSVRYDYADREFIVLRHPLLKRIDYHKHTHDSQVERKLPEFVDDGIYF